MSVKTQNQDRLRRIPQQARSKERFNQILDTAAEMFAVEGYEAVTTNAIAARAKMAIGALYRYFPDKGAILQALANRYFDQMREIVATEHTEEAAKLPLAVYVRRVIDAFDKFFQANPAYGVIFAKSRYTSPEILEADAVLNRELAQTLAKFYTLRNPNLKPEKSELVARIIVEVVGSLQLLGLSQDQVFQEQVTAETEQLMLAYLKMYFPD